MIKVTTIRATETLQYQIETLKEWGYGRNFTEVMHRAVDEIYHARLVLKRVELEQGAQSPLPQREE